MQVQSWHDYASDEKSCSSGEDRDKSQVCARHKAATFCAHNVCYAQEGIKRSRKQQNLRDLL